MRAAFLERGDAAMIFLTEKLDFEQRPEMRRDIVQILGSIRSVHALAPARELICSNDSEDRFCGIIVLGWIGHEEDFDELVKVMTADPDPLVRGCAATALYQMWLRIPDIKDRVVGAIIATLRNEKDDDAIMRLVVSLQYINGKYFGKSEKT